MGHVIDLIQKHTMAVMRCHMRDVLYKYIVYSALICYGEKG